MPSGDSKGPGFNDCKIIHIHIGESMNVEGAQKCGPSFGGGWMSGLAIEVIVELLQIVGKQGPVFAENSPGIGSALQEF